MPRLYCEDHGKEACKDYESETAESLEGQGILVTSQALKGGPWLCDRCNKALDRGDVAYLVVYLNPDMVDSFEHDYDFSYEYDYFGTSIGENDIRQFGFKKPLPL